MSACRPKGTSSKIISLKNHFKNHDTVFTISLVAKIKLQLTMMMSIIAC